MEFYRRLSFQSFQNRSPEWMFITIGTIRIVFGDAE